MALNARQIRTLERVFAQPVRSDIRWSEIENLLAALGAVRTEGRGSRVRFLLNGRIGLFHRPHPSPHTDKGAVRSLRNFLEAAGIRPD